MDGKRFRRLIVVLFLFVCILPFLIPSSTNQAPQSFAVEQLGTPFAQTAIATQMGTVTQTPQSFPLDQLGTPFAQTAAAAETQIVISPSLTPTLTPPAVETLAGFSSTPAIILTLPGFTQAVEVPTSDGAVQIPGGGGYASDNVFTSNAKQWSCAIIDRYPPREVIFEKGQNFYASISILNTGAQAWDNDTIHFAFMRGFHHDGRRIQLLPTTIVPGRHVSLIILFTAPLKHGVYNSFWSLEEDDGHTFCNIKITFKVN